MSFPVDSDHTEDDERRADSLNTTNATDVEPGTDAMLTVVYLKRTYYLFQLVCFVFIGVREYGGSASLGGFSKVATAKIRCAQ